MELIGYSEDDLLQLVFEFADELNIGPTLITLAHRCANAVEWARAVVTSPLTPHGPGYSSFGSATLNMWSGVEIGPEVTLYLRFKHPDVTAPQAMLDNLAYALLRLIEVKQDLGDVWISDERSAFEYLLAERPVLPEG